MKLSLADPRAVLLSILSGRKTRQNLRLIAQRAIALGMAALLLPLAQIDALAQQQWPQQSSPYPNQYGQPNPYYAPQQPQYPQQPAYQGQPYGQQQYPQQPAYQGQPYAQQQYPQQAPAPEDYTAQGDYPDQYGAGQSPNLSEQPEQGFASQQLEQLVAPIALYPDALVAQILAASTYPASGRRCGRCPGHLGPQRQGSYRLSAGSGHA